MALPPKYKIHPAIGIARLGNAPADTFFIGPETPGRPPEGDPSTGTTVPPFKDSPGRIKPQAARFRIWEYVDNGHGKYKPNREITAIAKGVEWIEWKVHLANKKAAFVMFLGLLGDPVFGPRQSTPTPTWRNAKYTGSDRKKLWLDPGIRTIRAVKGKSLANDKIVKSVEFRKGTAPSAVTEHWPDPAPTPPIEYLGELRTDDLGRLVVIGGRGDSSAVGGIQTSPITEYANNDGWFDDTSDGPVLAKVKFKNTANPVDVDGAWVICGPPDFAPFSQNVVTLYDLLFDLAARELILPTNDSQYDGVLEPLRKINSAFKVSGKSLSNYEPSFDQEIWPILKRAVNVTWLFAPAQHSHVLLGADRENLAKLWPVLANNKASESTRKAIFIRLRPPGGGGGPNQNMPRLLGDDPYQQWNRLDRRSLTLTHTQYALLEEWANGHFRSGSLKPPAGLPRKPSIPLPHDFDRAALENCVGGAFYPGIEVGWQIRHSGIYQEPFRIKHGAPSAHLFDARGNVGPGYFTRQMAVPWQADFLRCSQRGPRPRLEPGDWGWWPAQRPDDVYLNAGDAKQRTNNTMVLWHRSTKGGTPADWPVGYQASRLERLIGGRDDKTMPSYEEMLNNWRSFGFIHERGGVQFEDERPTNVP